MSIKPTRFTYTRWRHGGWYVSAVRYPSGAIGCVSRNYDDKKWRIACDPRGFEKSPTFKSRDDAAGAEWDLAQAEFRAMTTEALDARVAEAKANFPNGQNDAWCDWLRNEHASALSAVAAPV